MTPDRDREIRDRAYQIWESEGRPQGCEAAHWERARSEIDAAEGGGAGQSYSGEAPDGYGVSGGGQMTGGIPEGGPDAAPNGFDGESSGGMAPGAKRPRRQKQGTRTQDR